VLQVVTLRELGLEGQAGATLTFLDAHGRDPERDAVYDAVRPSAAPSLHLRDLAEGSVVCFRSAHLGLSKATSWYQYGFHTLQGPVNRTVSAPIVRSAAQTLARRFGVTAASPSLTTTTTEGWTVVLLTRSRNRRILNQAELVDRLGAKFNRSVVQLSMETHTFPEICRALWTAGVVVAMHGSLLIAAIFMQPGALLVELFPFGVRPEQYTPYRTAAALLHLQYVGWTNMNASATVSHPTRVAALGGIAHLAPEHQQRIKSTRWVPPHLCCSDPFWLYRIFSDTVVDVSDVLNRLPQPFTVDADTDSSSLTKQPHVSLVPATSRSPARCTIIEREPPMLRIEFDASWSAAFVPGLFYEVQVDELGQRWRTSDPFLIVNVSAKRAVLTGSTLSVWVQCRTETHLGRFVQSTCHLSP
jgi:protein O-mannose beta-1,4-N-acetylglucosaminyltransferase